MSHGLEPNACTLADGKAASLALNIYVKSQQDHMLSGTVGIGLNTNSSGEVPEKFQGLLQRVPSIKETSAENTMSYTDQSDPKVSEPQLHICHCSYFISVAMRNILTKKATQGTRYLFQFKIQACSPSLQESHSGRSWKQRVTSHLQTGQRD